MDRKEINRFELKAAITEVNREMKWLTRILDDGDDLLEQDHTRIAVRTTDLLSFMSRLLEAQNTCK